MVAPRSGCSGDGSRSCASARAPAAAEALRTAAPPAPTLPELLVALREAGETGALEIRAGGVCTRIILRDGLPVFAEGGSLRETLGRMLLRRGALSEADYVRVIERMTERVIEHEATRMGEVLVELGLLSPSEVFQALSAQVIEKIVGCFRWPHFEHDFQAVDALPEEVLAFGCPPLDALLLSGIRAHFGPDRLAPLLAASRGGRAALAAPPAELVMRFQLGPGEQRLVHLLDGRSLEEVRVASPLDAVHTDQVLAALQVAGALRWAAPAERAQPRGGAARAGAASAPPPRAASAAHAEASAAPMTPPPSPRTVLGRIGGSRAGAGAAARKAPQLEAERLFRQGVRLLEQPALPGALRCFEQACELAPDEPEYRMYEAWTAWLTAREDDARRAARERAAAAAERLLQRDRDAVRAHAILGQLRLAGGDVDAAERHFRAALRVAPEDREALRGLRLVGRRRAGGH